MIGNTGFGAKVGGEAVVRAPKPPGEIESATHKIDFIAKDLGEIIDRIELTLVRVFPDYKYTLSSPSAATDSAAPDLIGLSHAITVVVNQCAQLKEIEQTIARL